VKKVLIAAIIVILIGISLLIYYVVSTKQRDRYHAYQNARFGFSVDYPIGWKLGEAPTNNDGRQFTSEDGKTICRAYGFANALTGTNGQPQTLNEYTNWLAQNDAESGITSEILEREEMTLDEKEAVYIYLDKGANLEEAVYTLDDETGYGLSCVYPDQKTGDSNKTIFSHMRESFKIESAE
jgi:hypothetical protein